MLFLCGIEAALVRSVGTFWGLWFCYSSAPSSLITSRKLLRVMKPTTQGLGEDFWAQVLVCLHQLHVWMKDLFHFFPPLYVLAKSFRLSKAVKSCRAEASSRDPGHCAWAGRWYFWFLNPTQGIYRPLLLPGSIATSVQVCLCPGHTSNGNGFCVSTSKFQLGFEPIGFLFSNLNFRATLLHHLFSGKEKNQILLNDCCGKSVCKLLSNPCWLCNQYFLPKYWSSIDQES